MNFHMFAVLSALALLATRTDAAIDVRKFGAKGDGTKDDSAAIQKALNAAAAKGGVVELDAGHFKLKKPIQVPEGVTLAGVWQAPHHAQLRKGTVFLVHADKGRQDGALIMLNPSSCVKGITFFYPEQQLPDAIPYPWTIQGKGMHCSVINCTFVNSYKAIDFGTHFNELHYIRNCFGCPLKVGIHIDQCTDIGRIENVHFNPHYWMRSGASKLPTWQQVMDYVGANLVAFEFGHTDWEYVLNTFCFGAKIGYRFYDSGKHANANGNFVGIGADMCEIPLLVESSQPPGLLITNGEFVANRTAKAFIEVKPANYGIVQLANCSFWGPCATVAILEGTGTLNLNQCTFHNHGKPEDAWTIEAKSGNLVVQGCRFGWDRPDIRLEKDVKTAVIMGNRFFRSKQIENASEGDVQEGLNVVEK